MMLRNGKNNEIDGAGGKMSQFKENNLTSENGADVNIYPPKR